MEMIVSVLVVLGPLVFFHELGHFVLAKLSHIRVEEFGLGYPPRLLRLAKVGDTEYTLNILPLGGFVRLSGEEDPEIPDSFASKSWVARAATLIAGPAMNLILAAFLLAFLFSWAGIPTPIPGSGVVVNMVAPNSPAQQGGLQAGDLIQKADGQPVESLQDFQNLIRTKGGESVQLTVERKGELLSQPITVVPRANPPKNEGPLGVQIGPQVSIKRYPWYESIPMGFQYTGQITVAWFTGISQMLRQQIKPELAGPIGIADIATQAARAGIENLIFLAAVLSVNLALINLIPFPALDGGRLIFIVIEVLRGGRRVDPAKERFVHLIGMAVLLTLMLVISVFDVQRIMSGGFGP